jgi:hypothetical protein
MPNWAFSGEASVFLSDGGEVSDKLVFVVLEHFVQEEKVQAKIGCVGGGAVRFDHAMIISEDEIEEKDFQLSLTDKSDKSFLEAPQNPILPFLVVGIRFVRRVVDSCVLA